jgi:hypothetical protein
MTEAAENTSPKSTVRRKSSSTALHNVDLAVQIARRDHLGPLVPGHIAFRPLSGCNQLSHSEL